MDFTTLQFDVRDGVAHISLNRPEALNTVNMELARDLAGAALRCQEDPAVRAVLLAGAGRVFCAGGDLRTFQAQQEGLPSYVHEVTAHLHTAVSRLARMDAPVVAAVQGSAAGAGMSLACACDLVVAAASARFTMAYTRVGLTPDGSATYFLPRIVGLRRALDLTLTNRALSAQEALEWGIVSRVVPDAELAGQAEALARQLAAGPTGAFGAAKRLLLDGCDETLETQMTHETRSIAARTQTVDGREGIGAFLEKRPPEYSGD